jgi:hypothetical protein
MQNLNAQILLLLIALLRKLGFHIEEKAPPQDVIETLAKAIQSGRRSWRPEQFAFRHSLSPSFIYNEIRGLRLRARKPSDSTTIITGR